MKLSSEVWNLMDESFGPLLPYIKDINVTDINYNGSDVWIEDLNRGRYKATATDPAVNRCNHSSCIFLSAQIPCNYFSHRIDTAVPSESASIRIPKHVRAEEVR